MKYGLRIVFFFALAACLLT